MLIKSEKGQRQMYSHIIEFLKKEDINNKRKNHTTIVDINPYNFI